MFHKILENWHSSDFMKIDYFSNSSFQISVFGNGEMKWLQIRKRRLQEKYQRA